MLMTLSYLAKPCLYMPKTGVFLYYLLKLLNANGPHWKRPKPSVMSLIPYEAVLCQEKILVHFILFRDRGHEFPYGLTAVPSLLRTGLQ